MFLNLEDPVIWKQHLETHHAADSEPAAQSCALLRRTWRNLDKTGKGTSYFRIRTILRTNLSVQRRKQLTVGRRDGAVSLARPKCSEFGCDNLSKMDTRQLLQSDGIPAQQTCKCLQSSAIPNGVLYVTLHITVFALQIRSRSGFPCRDLGCLACQAVLLRKRAGTLITHPFPCQPKRQCQVFLRTLQSHP